MADSINLAFIHWASLTLAEFPLPNISLTVVIQSATEKKVTVSLLPPVGCKPDWKIPLRDGSWAAGAALWNKFEFLLRHKVRNAEMPFESFHTSMRAEPAMQPMSPKEESFFSWTSSFEILFSVTLGSYESLGVDSVWGEAETSCGSPCLLWAWISRRWTSLWSALETSLGCQKGTGSSILWAGLFAISKLLWTLQIGKIAFQDLSFH